MYRGVVYYSFEELELKEATEKYIIYYNEQRIKLKLGWLNPIGYRLSLLATPKMSNFWDSPHPA